MPLPRLRLPTLHGWSYCSSLSDRSRDARFAIRLRPDTPLIARFNSGRLKDALDGFIQQGVVLGIGLLGQQPLYERPRKARHDAVVPTQPIVAFFPRIASR